MGWNYEVWLYKKSTDIFWKQLFGGVPYYGASKMQAKSLNNSLLSFTKNKHFYSIFQ